MMRNCSPRHRILKIYVSKNYFSKNYIGKLTKLKEEIRKSKSLARDFNSHFSVFDKVGSKPMNVRCPAQYYEPIGPCWCRVFYTQIVEYTFLSRGCRKLARITTCCIIKINLKEYKSNKNYSCVITEPN